jgi:hypothetical protein
LGNFRPSEQGKGSTPRSGLHETLKSELADDNTVTPPSEIEVEIVHTEIRKLSDDSQQDDLKRRC